MQREQIIKGKQCEIKPAKSREVGYMVRNLFAALNLLQFLKYILF